MQFSCTILALDGGTFALTFHHKGSSSGQLFNSGKIHEATLPNQQRKQTTKNINKKNDKEIKKVNKKTEKVVYVTVKYHHAGTVHIPNVAHLTPGIITTTEPHELLVNTFGLNQRVTAVPVVGDIKSSILHPSESLSFELVGTAAGLTQSVTTIQDFLPTQFSTSIAGLKVECIIDEPTAAADKAGDESNVLVFDLGGSTFDVTLLTIDNDVLEVLATIRDNHLVGEDFDQRVIQYFLKVTKKEGNQDTSGDKKALHKLHKEVDGVKRAFSSQQQVRLEIKALAEGFDFSMTLTRVLFEELNSDFSKKTLGPMANVLYDADVSKSEVGKIVLVGGSTRIPEVQSFNSEYFGGKKPSEGESVAYSAAVQGGIPSGEGGDATSKILLLDVSPFSQDFETVGGAMTKFINRGTTNSAKKSQTFLTLQDSQPAVNIQVYEGERSNIKDNHLLGQFGLTVDQNNLHVHVQDVTELLAGAPTVETSVAKPPTELVVMASVGGAPCPPSTVVPRVSHHVPFAVATERQPVANTPKWTSSAAPKASHLAAEGTTHMVNSDAKIPVAFGAERPVTSMVFVAAKSETSSTAEAAAKQTTLLPTAHFDKAGATRVAPFVVVGPAVAGGAPLDHTRVAPTTQPHTKSSAIHKYPYFKIGALALGLPIIISLVGGSVAAATVVDNFKESTLEGSAERFEEKRVAISKNKSMIGSATDKLRELLQPSGGVLQGIGDSSDDSLAQAATVLLDAKDMLKSRNDQVKLLQTQMKQGNNDAATRTLKEMMAEVQPQQDVVQSELGLQAPVPHLYSKLLDNTDNPQEYWEGVSPSELSKTEQTLHAITDHNDFVVNVLEDVHVSVTSLRTRVDVDKEDGEYNFEDFDSGFSSDAVLHSSITKSSSFQAVVNKEVNGKKERFRHHLKKHSPEGQGKRHLQRIANTAQCEADCKVEEKACNCAVLKQCVNNMKSYDSALSFVGGYVNTEQGNPEYGNFTAQKLTLFDVGGTLPTKISTIKSLAQESGDDCTDLLAEFTTVCDPEATSCSSTNDYSHQLTIQQICNNVHNPKKLLISAIAHKLDGINEMSDPFMDGRLDARVKDWYVKHKPVVEYQHLWNGACAEGDDINKADNKHQLRTELDLKGENDEQNVEECAKQCKNRSGCLSFSIPYPNRYYDYMGGDAKCHLYNVQCKKFKDHRFWNSYQMGCGGDTCKKEWLDQSYVHNVRKVRIQVQGMKILRMCQVKIYRDDTNLVNAGIMSASQSSRSRQNVHSMAWKIHDDTMKPYSASACLDGNSNDNYCCTNGRHNVYESAQVNKWQETHNSNEVRPWWEVDLGADTTVRKVQIDQCGGWDSLSNLDIQLISQDDVVLATVSTGSGLNGWYWSKSYTTSINDASGFIRNKCIRKCHDEIKEVLDKEKNKWQNAQPKPEESSTRCDKVSWTVCSEFVNAFNRLYQLRNTHDYVEGNPMMPGGGSSPGWYLGGSSQTCHQTCDSHLLQCTENSVSKQTALAPSNSYGALAAFKEAGASCSTMSSNWRDNAGSPFAMEMNGEVYCVGFGKEGDGSRGSKTSPNQSTCDGALASNVWRKKAALCYCERSSLDRASLDRVTFPIYYDFDQNSHGIQSYQVGEYLFGNHNNFPGTTDRKVIQGTWVFDTYTYAYSMHTTPGCPSSLSDGSALKAMENCDRSMALLLGPLTSIGTLQAIVNKVTEKKNQGKNFANYMPGECCLDTALEADHLGYNYNKHGGMSCKKHGPWHLGISKEACEHARGRWFRTPCVTLKECTDNRPVDGTVEYSQSFEDFAIDLAIADPHNNTECEAAREKLGFDPNHPHDTEICKKFEEYMCEDDLFDGIDLVTEALEKPPEYEAVAYDPIEYEKDEALSFEDLPEREELTLEKLNQKDAIFGQMQGEKLAMEKLYEILQLIADLTMQLLDVVCDNASSFILLPTIMMKSPPAIACDASRVIMANVWLIVLPIVQIPTIIKTHKYEVDTLGDGQLWDIWVLGKNNAKHLDNFDKWSVHALGTINKNVHDQHKEIRSQLQNRHTMMENHINQLSTKYTNHLGDYVEKVASMVYNHHSMMFNKIGAIAENTSGVLDQAEGMSDEVFEPASLTPSQSPVTLAPTRKQGGWYLGGSGETCHQTCDSHLMQCTEKSVSKQTALAPSKKKEALAAFTEAGASCSKIYGWRDNAGSPFVMEVIGTGQFYCFGFGQEGDGSMGSNKSAATSRLHNHHVGSHKSSKQSSCDGAVANIMGAKKNALCYCEQAHLSHSDRSTRKAKSEVPDKASVETSPTVQDVQLNQWKLPPTLDVQWPKGHSSLWELISNEVGDHVEGLGISVLTALGADAVVSKRLAGTSERHFELDVTWPNGGNHILDEVKNHVRQVEDKVSGKVIRVEDKVNQVVEKVHQIEAKMTKIENMMEQLLEKMG